MKLMTKSIEKELTPRSEIDPGLDSKVVVKYFNPCGSGTWLITNGEQQKTVTGCSTAMRTSSAGSGVMCCSPSWRASAPVRLAWESSATFTVMAGPSASWPDRWASESGGAMKSNKDGTGRLQHRTAPGSL